jgi:hypothetical protein
MIALAVMLHDQNTSKIFPFNHLTQSNSYPKLLAEDILIFKQG